MDRNDYRKVMKAALKKQNLTVKELAEQIHISPSVIYRALNGTANTSLTTIKAVSKKLRLDLERLVIVRYECGISQSKNEKILLLDYFINKNNSSKE